MTGRASAAWLCVGFVGAAACETRLSPNPEGFLCEADGSCPQGFACVEGTCQQEGCPGGDCEDAGTHACETKRCDSPPKNACQNATVLKAYAALGVCEEGPSCRYPAAALACAVGCEKDHCVDELCRGVWCVTPPGPSCADGQTLKTHAATGACNPATGRCEYPATSTVCRTSCKDGTCEGQDLCSAVQCNSPPGPTCVFSTTVRKFSLPGGCAPETGLCSFPYVDEDCPGGTECEAGTCRSPGLSFVQPGPRVVSQLNAAELKLNTSGSNVVVVGPRGFAAKWNGIRWTVLASGTQQNLRALWLSSDNARQGWVVGEGGTVLRYDGNGLFAETLPALDATEPLVAIHGRSVADAIVAGEDGSFWRWSAWMGAQPTWSAGELPPEGKPYGIRDVWMDSEGNVRLVGSCKSQEACVVYLPVGGAPGVHADPATSVPFAAVGPGPAPGEAWVGTAAPSTSLRRHVPSFPFFDSAGLPALGAGNGVRGITPAGGGTFVLVGANPPSAGALFSVVAGNPQPEVVRPVMHSRQLLSKNNSGGVLLTDGSAVSSTIYYLSSTAGPTVLDLGEHWLRAAFSAKTGTLFLMNAFGDLGRRTPQQTLELSRNGDVAVWTDLVALGTGVLLVGKGGRVARWTPQAGFEALTSQTLQDLNAVCRVSDTRLYAVGAGGTLLFYDGHGFTPMTSGTPAGLLDAHCSPNGNVVVVGEGATVLTLAWGSWVPVVPAFPSQTARLNNVWRSSTGTFFVLGTDGPTRTAVFARFEKGTWTSFLGTPLLDNLVGFGVAELYATSGKQVLGFDGAGWRVVAGGDVSFTLRGAATAGARAFFVGDNGLLVESQ